MAFTPTWSQVAGLNNVWHGEYYVPGMKSRSTAVLLRPGEFLVYSPGRQLVGPFVEHLRALGEPTYLLIPNAFHNLGIRAWQEKFPKAIFVASSTALPRLKRLGYPYVIGLEHLGHLPQHMSVVEPQALRFGETWLRLQQDEVLAWVVCDGFFNMPKPARKWHLRLWQKMTVAAPGLAISAVVKWVMVRNRHQYKQWIERQIGKDQPNLLIPCHGDIIRDAELPGRLQDLAMRRL